ncbi:LacI family transcriptional regulator [Alicyclobacillus fastidiosus]|uniref:LacI family transcriptional regulator n=1 Tax=Alicyclobacillus fastidiosus TaxID=392011 RepID=A0ABY6ZI73_9BACL|nr:LacI family DNA-binding transcriptional regulator [Alicyclobacillus fastidiosus]WAH41615.1 LacI family transcriptional regulator [Alicyclobacillus fastidiosus]GMA63280.1 LacI family transcriptional regulator [Alicyclobacillus fastidiosus]
MVTIRDIAKAAGVSNSTVSKALKNSPLVKASTKQKILDIANRLHYRRNIHASQLVSGKSGLIGLVLSNFGNPLFSNLAVRMNQELKQRGYEMILSLSEHGIQLFEQLRVEGVLYWGDLNRGSEIPEQLLAVEIPVLQIGNDALSNFPSVLIDRGLAIKSAIDYLLECGHRQIGLIGDSQAVKLNSFKSYMRVCGFDVPDEYVLASNETWLDGYYAVKNYVFTRSSPTAFIGSNNLVTKGALRALLERGLQVPEEISLIGYDDLPDMEQAEVPITTVGPSLEQLAVESVDMMLSIVDGESVEPATYILPRMAVRKSVRSR